MNKSTNQTDSVNQFMKALDYPLKEVVELVRSTILASDPEITEHIKWNAPSFCYQNQDRVTLNLRSADFVQLVFHRGSKVKDSHNFTFEDDSGLLEWVAVDRAVVKLHDEAEAKAKAAALANVVIQWMRTTA
ncbi:MAG: DUF1801 domain-containing protein [Anaerolineae bacterium]